MRIGAPYRGGCMNKENPFRTEVRAVEVENGGDSVSVLVDCALGGGGG